MTGQIAGGTRDPGARVAGAVYLLYFLTAILGSVITPAGLSGLVAHQAQFRVGVAVSLLAIGLYVGLTALLYNLFKNVDGRVALLAAFVSLVGCTTQAVASAFQIVPLLTVAQATHASAFTAVQLQALAQTFLDVTVQANQIAVVFFGAFDVAIGYLIVRSTFLPRALGLLMVTAGAGWLIFLAPPLAHDLQIPIEVLGFIAELTLMLWLLIRGVDAERWTQQVGA
jgi:hypothetical protein